MMMVLTMVGMMMEFHFKSKIISLKKRNFITMKRYFIFVIIALFSFKASATYLLIPMDDKQKNHLKAYGIAYWVLENDVEIDWLLNYRGGSFMIKHIKAVEEELIIRGISFEVIANAKSTAILSEIADPEVNMDVVKLQKAPKIAVYSPKNKQPWDDAVTLVLTYAEIPYDVVYDDEIVEGLLPKYDWLHLHHEDFTGQYGKFYAHYKNHAWYKEQVRYNEETATRLGFSKVSQLKLAVAKNIKNYTSYSRKCSHKMSNRFFSFKNFKSRKIY